MVTGFARLPLGAVRPDRATCQRGKYPHEGPRIETITVRLAMRDGGAISRQTMQVGTGGDPRGA